MDTQDSTPATDDGQLRSLVERIEFIEREIKEKQEDRKDVYAEAKGLGFDPAIIRLVVKDRAADPNDLSEREALLETYKRAIGMASAEVSF